MKKIFIIIGVIAVIIVGVLIVLLSSLDRIVAAAIEHYGSMTTQTDVSVSSVSIKLKSGEGSVKGLMIANPPGFSSKDAFTLGDISVKIDPSSVTKDTIIIDRILVSKPYITYEINSSGKANINVINQNIKKEGKSETAVKREGEKGQPKKKLLIRKFEIDGSQIDVRIPVMPEPLSVKMSRIEVSNLGEGGASPEEISTRILDILVKNVGSAVSKAGVEKYLGKSVEEMKGVLQGEVEKKAGKAVEGLSEEAGKALNKFLGK